MSNKKDLLALKLKLCTLALSSAVATSLVGCSQELPTNSDIQYSTLDQSNVDDIKNGTFISGFSYGMSGSVTQKRRLESDYLSEGVYANQISSVIDLIIINQNNKTSCVSVNSDITIPVWLFVKFVGKYSAYYNNYYYDGKDMVTQKLTEDEYNDIVNGNGYQKVLN